jgi:biopolymer transport protein ExbB
MKTLISRVLPAIALLTLAAMPLIGADGEAVAPAAKKQVSAFQMIIDSGWTEWQIIVLSIVAFAMSIQCFITIKREAIIPPGIAEDLHNVFAEGATDEAVEQALSMTQNDPSYVGQVIAAAIDKKDFGYDAMIAAAESTATAEGNRWNGKIGWLQLFAAIGTMMGLFGTVWGMIGAFMDMAANPTGVDASMLAGTIGGALITTANGLIVAIPMLIFVFILRARLNQYILDATVISNEILDYFRTAR